jgi:hypothetical protein
VTTICWTVIHHTAAPIAHGASGLAHVARRLVGPLVRHGAHAVPHGVRATHPRIWFELICKVVPAAVAGGGLLIPRPTDLPLPAEPPALTQPAPPRLPWAWPIPPTVVPKLYLGPPADARVIEPSTGPLLLTALGALVVVRFAARTGHKR